MPRYLYGMRHQRGFGPGCQPGRGLIGREDDPAGGYNDVLVYDRELEPHEIDIYELDFMGVEPDTTTDGSNVVKKGGNDEDRTSCDCISRQAAKDIFTELYGISAIGSVFDQHEWADICETTANELPSVQPDIIRCPDCYYNDGTAYCELHFRNVKAKDFCSWAERRE